MIPSPLYVYTHKYVYRYLSLTLNYRFDRIETQLMVCASDLLGGATPSAKEEETVAGGGAAAKEEDELADKPRYVGMCVCRSSLSTERNACLYKHYVYSLPPLLSSSANLLVSLFVSYNESKHNIEFRRHLYYATLATKMSIFFPLVILWLWGVVAITTVNPPAVGWGILLVGSMLIFGLYGFTLWKSQGWCMSPMAFRCLCISAGCAICFIIVVVFANPAVMFGHQALDFLSLSAVFGKLVHQARL